MRQANPQDIFQQIHQVKTQQYAEVQEAVRDRINTIETAKQQALGRQQHEPALEVEDVLQRESVEIEHPVAEPRVDET